MCALSLGPVGSPAGTADDGVFINMTLVFKAFMSIVGDVTATPRLMRLIPYVTADAAVLFLRHHASRDASREALAAMLEVSVAFATASPARLETGEDDTERRRFLPDPTNWE